MKDNLYEDYDKEDKEVEKASFTGQWSRIQKKFDQSGLRIFLMIFPPHGLEGNIL